MPMHHMLYLCPRCGHDPLMAVERRAECRSCGTVFERGMGASILVKTPGKPIRISTAKDLIEATETVVTASCDACIEKGSSIHQARVAIGHARGQHVVRFDDRVLGFCERIKSEEEGILRLDSDHLTLLAEGSDPRVWSFDAIGAIQISAQAIQINLPRRGLYQFEFLEDSPKRWEDLIQFALRHFYAARGRVVVQFQPQIVTEDLP
ncbi:uncharacterized protein METZ01_LOCUS182809 [marine metagenome]|uniref:Uncharacterized protein n=1 Tax=marine metagenome TaxID=408172 RepID=A0A382CV53_9ZZZZ